MDLKFGHYLLILFLMYFFHVIEDYHLQDILASMKQKEWWKKNVPDDLYKSDYLVALITHSFEWSFFITIPWLIIAFITCKPWLIGGLIVNYIINTGIHAFVDHLKANEHLISLEEDQMYHFYQIIFTWLILIITCCI